MCHVACLAIDRLAHREQAYEEGSDSIQRAHGLALDCAKVRIFWQAIRIDGDTPFRVAARSAFHKMTGIDWQAGRVRG